PPPPPPPPKSCAPPAPPPPPPPPSLSARQINRALDLMQDRVITDFLQNPTPPGTLDLSMVTPATLTDTPDQLLTVAANLLIGGDTGQAGVYLDHLAEIAETA